MRITQKLADGKGLFIYISNRKDGTMDYSSDGTNNLLEYVACLNPKLVRTVLMNQIHSGIVCDSETVKKNDKCDGLVTGSVNTALVVRSADCYPVILWCDRTPALGVFHAGYKGIQAGIVRETILKMEMLGAVDIKVVIGPGICTNCYDVPRERFLDFAKNRIHSKVGYIREDRYHLDLRSVITDELIACGIKAKHVRQLNYCTKEDKTLFSYRRDREQSGRFATVAYIE